MSSKHNSVRGTEGSTVSVPDLPFTGGPLVDQVPFRVHRKAAELLDRMAAKHGFDSRTEYVRRIVYERLAQELEEEAREIRAAVG